MTTHSHARGGSKTPHPIRGAYPSPSALQGICLPACLPPRTADRRRPRRSKDWGARRSAACPSPSSANAKPIHATAMRRVAGGRCAPACRAKPTPLPSVATIHRAACLLCSALPACLPACLPPRTLDQRRPQRSADRRRAHHQRSADRRRAHHVSCRAARRRVPWPVHLPTTCLCRTCRAKPTALPSGCRRPPCCPPVCLPTGGSPAPSPLGGSPACLPCPMPPTVRLARRSACADRPILPAYRLPPPSLLCPTDCRAPPFAAACRAAACATCLPPRTADRLRHRRSANRWHPYHARLAADRREPLPACQPAPRPAHTVTARRIASDLPATLPPCRHLPTFAMSFHRARRCAGTLRRQLPLPRQPNPATNEPTRKPLAATGSPASPPPRRPPLHHLSAFLPSCRLHRFLLLQVLPACPPCLRRPPLTPPPSLPPPHLLACAYRPGRSRGLPTLSLLLLAHPSAFSCIAPSLLAHPRRCAAPSPTLLRASTRRLRLPKENQSPPHVFARTRELPAWCQSVSAARCGLPLRFTRGSGCVFEVLLLREGVGRGSPRPRRLRRSRCRITLASKARLPVLRSLARCIHPLPCRQILLTEKHTCRPPSNEERESQQRPDNTMWHVHDP